MERRDSLGSGPYLVVLRFPDKAARIRRLFLHTPEFRAMCEDYALALNTLERLKRDGVQAAAEVIADYAGLIPELEAEIARTLDSQGGVALL